MTSPNSSQQEPLTLGASNLAGDEWDWSWVAKLPELETADNHKMKRMSRRFLESLSWTILEELVAVSEPNAPRDHDWLRAYIADGHGRPLVAEDPSELQSADPSRNS